MSLQDLGWDEAWATARSALIHPGQPARVVSAEMGICRLTTDPGDDAVRAIVPRGLDVAVGDWVVFDPAPTPAEPVVVVDVLPRRTVFTRAATGKETRAQVVAANVDTVFVVNALDARLSLRRIERYLALAWQSGATPVIVLTKADLVAAEALEPLLAQVRGVALGTPVHLVGAEDDRALHALDPYLPPGQTVALIGMSGAGKSTLLNRLADAQVAKTQAVRTDGKGRHTTTHRELFALPGGALVIDTPGMRGLALWDAGDGVDQAFADVVDIASLCRFRDCSHTAEPGCEVLAAVADGRLDRDRFNGWRKLEHELAHLAIRQDARLRAERAKQWKTLSKSAKSLSKSAKSRNRHR